MWPSPTRTRLISEDFIIFNQTSTFPKLFVPAENPAKPAVFFFFFQTIFGSLSSSSFNTYKLLSKPHILYLFPESAPPSWPLLQRLIMHLLWRLSSFFTCLPVHERAQSFSGRQSHHFEKLLSIFFIMFVTCFFFSLNCPSAFPSCCHYLKSFSAFVYVLCCSLILVNIF